jgi:hypothetical protein
MAGDTRQTALFRPTTIAVHDDCNMHRDLPRTTQAILFTQISPGSFPRTTCQWKVLSR